MRYPRIFDTKKRGIESAHASEVLVNLYAISTNDPRTGCVSVCLFLGVSLIYQISEAGIEQKLKILRFIQLSVWNYVNRNIRFVNDGVNICCLGECMK